MKLTLNYPPIWLAGFMALAWFIAKGHAPLGDSYVLVGRIIIGASLAIMVWAAFAFWRARTTIVPHEAPKALVETGPFQFSRNPIYLADLVILAGWSFSVGSPITLLLLVPFYFVLLHLFILPEEARLTDHLGEDYVRYKSRVRRWI